MRVKCLAQDYSAVDRPGREFRVQSTKHWAPASQSLDIIQYNEERVLYLTSCLKQILFHFAHADKIKATCAVVVGRKTHW